MKLSDHDLRQIDTEYLGRLSHAQLLHVSAQLLADLKAARDRANQTPDNSSRPPGSFAPWETGSGGVGAWSQQGRPSRRKRGDRCGAGNAVGSPAVTGPAAEKTGQTAGECGTRARYHLAGDG